MKNKIIRIVALLMSLSLVFTLWGCSSDSSSESEEDSTKKKNKTEVNAEDENDTSTDKEESKNSNFKSRINKDLTTLAENDTQTLENVAEFCLEYSAIATKINPPSPDSYYTYYEAEKGKTYVDICFAYKNLETSAIDADEVISGTLYYGEKYAYSGFSIIEEDNRSNFTYTSITDISPLATEYLHFLFEVPEELETSDYSLIAELSIKGTKYNIVVKDGKYIDDAQPTPNKTTGEITTGEEIITGKSEFTLESSQINAKINPPTPGSYYTYYEADDGKVYVDICFEYKNLGEEEIEADEIFSAKLTYDGKYSYDGFSVIEEDNRGNFTYTGITDVKPLATEYIHYLFEVPEEVGTSTNPISILITIDGNSYTYILR